jgi:hypothetical protein
MPTLTRRRSHDSHRETWVVFYGDVPVGTIAERAGPAGSLPHRRHIYAAQASVRAAITSHPE